MAEPSPVTIWTPGKGAPIPRYKRNPRRAYDPEGREIIPVTIANSRQNGACGIMVSCRCGHEETIPFDGLADTAFVPDVALKLRCSTCRGKSKDVETQPDFTGRATAGTGPHERFMACRLRVAEALRLDNELIENHGSIEKEKTMHAQSARQVPLLTGKAGMQAFMSAFLDPGIRDKAIVETAEDDNSRPFIICSVSKVRAGMSAGEGRLFADSFENAINKTFPGGHTPVTKLCMLIREAATRAEQWAAK